MWGVSTRLIGGMIMTHSDDDGLVIPPRVTPTHIVVLPVTPKEGYSRSSSEILRGIGQESQNSKFATDSIRVEIDDRDLRGGEKYWQWVKKGIPLTVEVGPRDLENGTVYVGRRDLGSKRESIDEAS